MSDSVNKPEHYTYGKYECIDVIHELTKDLAGVQAFCLGNTLKYLWRFTHKNGVEDLNKAKWYLDKLIKEFDTDTVVESKAHDTKSKENYLYPSNDHVEFVKSVDVYNAMKDYLGDATNPNKCVDPAKPNPTYTDKHAPRPVYQLDSEMNVVKDYPSIHAAIRAIKNNGVGYAVRHGTRCNGYYWRYK